MEFRVRVRTGMEYNGTENELDKTDGRTMEVKEKGAEA
jgi:hypothetical protein